MTISPAFSDIDYSAARAAMVASQLRTNAVDDIRVIAAMREVPRESFVPTSHRAVAYIDRALPMAGGRALNPPMTTALLLDAATIGRQDRVLIVGAATGYAAAIAMSLSNHVTAIESDAALRAVAGPGVMVIDMPLTQGEPAGAPYDAIVVDGAVEVVPEALIAQLAPGGRLTAALYDRGVTRLAVGRKGGSGFAMVPFTDAEAVVLPGFARLKEFVF